jgi:hypothetical protein
MKIWFDLCALYFSTGKVDMTFLCRSDVRQTERKSPCSLGLFSVRAVRPPIRNIFTRCDDTAFVFSLQGQPPEEIAAASAKANRFFQITQSPAAAPVRVDSWMS